MKKNLLCLVLVLLVCISFSISPAFAAGEKVILTVYGEYPTMDIDSEVYGELYTVNGVTYYGLRSGTDLDPFGSNYGNANGTGVGNSFDTLVKNTQDANGYGGKQRVHGSYKVNSNSCASCHITHNAPGDKLLFKTTIWNTCTTCHDGTLGTLNVLKTALEIKSDVDSNNDGIADSLHLAGGGTFAGPAGEGSSVHMATGILNINSAPGGNRISDNEDSLLGTTWGAEFTCASCHAPHGSYSPRLLHYNPNSVGTAVYDEGGFKRTNITVSKVTYELETKYVVSVNDNENLSDFNLRDKNPWLYGYTYDTPKKYWTKIYVDLDNNGIDADDWIYQTDPTRAWVDVLQVNYKYAYFTDTQELITEGATVAMDIAPAMVVGFNLGSEEQYKLNGFSQVLNYGQPWSLNKFCAACHTNYLRAAGQEAFNAEPAHKHSLDSDIPTDMVGGTDGTDGKLTCLTCHYAHGTTSGIMMDQDNKLGLYKDENPSSALKRYVNNAVCLKCHVSDDHMISSFITFDKN